MKAILSTLTLAYIFLFAGCCNLCPPKTVYVDRVVNVPVVCDIPKCRKPVLLDERDMTLSYTERAQRLEFNRKSNEAYESCRDNAIKVCQKKESNVNSK